MTVVERLVGADGRGIRVVDEVLDDRVVVRARRVRRGDRRRQDAREGREPVRGDDVARERLAGQRIANRRGERGEVARQKGLARHAPQERLTLNGSQPFVGAKHEELVAHHRPAAGAAELVALVFRLGRREEVLLIELIAAVELVGRAVHLVGSRFRDDGDNRLALAIFGGERVAKQAHFLHGVDRRVQRQIVEPQRPDIHAVDRVVGRAVTSAFDRDELIAAPELRVAREVPGRHARRERRQRQHGAAVQRQVFDLLLVDHLSDGCALRLQQRRLAGHGDRFADGCDAERDRRPRRFTLTQDEIRQLRGPETLQLDFDVIGSGRERGNDESSLAVGDGDALGVGAHVRDGDRGAWDDSLRRVRHLPDQTGRRRLLSRDRRRDQKQVTTMLTSFEYMNKLLLLVQTGVKLAGYGVTREGSIGLVYVILVRCYRFA